MKFYRFFPAFAPQILHQKVSTFHRTCKFPALKYLKMPATNPLSFLHPLYDIAVWQFILICGYTQKEEKRFKFTWKMHEVVANFLCQLLEVRAFDHLQSKQISEEVKSATGNWEVGQKGIEEKAVITGFRHILAQPFCILVIGSLCTHQCGGRARGRATFIYSTYTSWEVNTKAMGIGIITVLYPPHPKKGEFWNCSCVIIKTLPAKNQDCCNSHVE